MGLKFDDLLVFDERIFFFEVRFQAGSLLQQRRHILGEGTERQYEEQREKQTSHISE
jgi:hypothetical protein